MKQPTSNTLLVIDDDEIYAAGIRRALRPLGIEVEHAQVLTDAVSQIEKSAPRVILLDVFLGVGQLNGLEALPELLQVSPESRVVVVTGYYSERTGRLARSRGATAYVEKGDIEFLKRVIAGCYGAALESGLPSSWKFQR